MPMYEYFCPDCNVRFEKLIRHATPENAEGGIACPTCAQTDTRRVLSVFAAVSSGDGQSSMSAGGGCGCGGNCGCAISRN
jgi:putative FmdB family regulatory protein